jgi:SAM-dependent methyltransferase
MFTIRRFLFTQLNAYPIPDLLGRCKWINLENSVYHPKKPWGIELAPHITNQDLEKLTFLDDTFDIIITSDVMEHIRLDHKAFQEIRRVLRSGGIYIFTVPHFRNKHETLVRIDVKDPSDPLKDAFLTEKECHGDVNSEEGMVLSFRTYGTDLDQALQSLGFTVDYYCQDIPELGIMSTELFYCRLSK